MVITRKETVTIEVDTKIELCELLKAAVAIGAKLTATRNGGFKLTKETK